MPRLIARPAFLAVCVVVALIVPAHAWAAVDMFLKMSDITGESTDEGHKGEMIVLAWSWGASAGRAQTGKGTLPAACIQDLSITKWIDSASPQLIMNGATGKVAPEAVLTMRKAGGDQPLEFLVLKMTNVVVSSFSTGGSGGEDRLTENVTLRFESMRGEYRRQKPDGSLDEPIVFEIGGQMCR